ncbi:MAG: insulinase family protein, partial [Candidatus Latescibacteria bacterium]|nr:insulinase family protein [Candidatus Latescibacterota bacterium]
DRGISALAAQCVMDATPRHPSGELQKELLALGGRFKSESGYDYSYFDVTVPARSVTQGLALLSEGLIQPQLDAPVVDQAKGRVQSAVRATLSSAARAAVNAVRAELHKGTPLAAPLAVPEPEISALTPTLVERFYRTHYVAENLTVVITGDVTAEDVVPMIAAAFQDMPRGKAASRSRFRQKATQGPRCLVVRSPERTSGTTISVGFPAPAWGTGDAIALDLLMAMLVDSPTSRAERSINSGSADFSSVEGAHDIETDGGTVSISLIVDPARLEGGEDALLTLIEQARSGPITDEEFVDALRHVERRDLLARADLNGVGGATALAVLRGASGSDEVYLDRLKAVRKGDLTAVARKYLDLKKAVLVVMGPDNVTANVGASALERRVRDKQAVFEAAFRIGPQVPASTDAERTSRLDAPLKAISPQPIDAGRSRVARVVLPGGARLLTGEDHSAPLVAVAVYLMGGVRYESDDTNGATALLRETLLNSNDPKEPGLTYRQSLAGMGALVSSQDRDMWGCAVVVPSDSWREAIQHMGSMFAHPDLDTMTVDATRIQVLEALDRWLQDDQAQRERLIFPTKYQVSGYRLPSLGSHRTLVRMPHATVEDWYRKFVVQPNIVVCIIGDLNMAEAQPVVEQAFRDVSASPFRPGTVAQEGYFDGVREKWELGQGSNSTVSVAFNGPPARSPDISAFYVIASLLGGPKGWLEQYIMKTGGAKGANAIVSHALDESPIIASITVGGPLQEQDMVKLLYRQIKKAALLQLVGELAPDLENAKIHASGSYLMSLDSDLTRAFQYGRAELFGLGVDYPILLPARIDGVTSEDLLRVGLIYFQKDQWEQAPHAICETRPGGW